VPTVDGFLEFLEVLMMRLFKASFFTNFHKALDQISKFGEYDGRNSNSIPNCFAKSWTKRAALMRRCPSPA